jgi:carboxymethylenebutenolidase
MCHETMARPPLPPIAGGAGAAGSQRIILDAADGNRLRAFGAMAIDPEAPGVVILPDVRGLHSFYEQLAVRFAEAGVHATALDYFGRTAGTDERAEGFDHMTHRRRMTSEGTAADIAAAVAFVRSAAGGGAERVFTVGFCMGGRISFNQAADRDDLDGVIGFYGTPDEGGPDDPRAPIALAPGYRCPVLGLFGGADEGISVEALDGFRRALTDSGVPNEIVVYEGAPHSFFDRSFEEHREACEDAWRRVLSFVRGSGA